MFAMMSSEEMEHMLARLFRSLTPDENSRAVNAFWYSVDAFLMATGNISKTFWPPQPRKKTVDSERNRKRGEELRSILGVEDESPFKKENRTLRDHFEHFDERLDKWFFQSRRLPVIIDSTIGPHFSIELIQRLVPSHVFRTFDPDSWTLSCLGDKLEFREMINAVKKLQASLEHNPPKAMH